MLFQRLAKNATSQIVSVCECQFVPSGLREMLEMCAWGLRDMQGVKNQAGNEGLQSWLVAGTELKN